MDARADCGAEPAPRFRTELLARSADRGGSDSHPRSPCVRFRVHRTGQYRRHRADSQRRAICDRHRLHLPARRDARRRGARGAGEQPTRLPIPLWQRRDHRRAVSRQPQQQRRHPATSRLARRGGTQFSLRAVVVSAKRRPGLHARHAPGRAGLGGLRHALRAAACGVGAERRAGRHAGRGGHGLCQWL